MAQSDTFERVLEALAQRKADEQINASGLVDPDKLARHLRFTLLTAGVAFVAAIVVLFTVRLASMTDQQAMLASVVGTMSAGLCLLALLSAGTAAGSAYAQQRMELRQARRDKEAEAQRRRLAEQDALAETERALNNSVAWQVGADLMFALTEDTKGSKPMDPEAMRELYAYMQYLSAYNKDQADELPNRRELAGMCQRVFGRYETRVGGSLLQQTAYKRVKISFEMPQERLKAA